MCSFSFLFAKLGQTTTNSLFISVRTSLRKQAFVEPLRPLQSPAHTFWHLCHSYTMHHSYRHRSRRLRRTKTRLGCTLAIPLGQGIESEAIFSAKSTARHRPRQEERTLRWLAFKCRTTKYVSVMSLKYTPVTQRILCLIFLMCVATLQYQTVVNKNLKTICSLWFWYAFGVEQDSNHAKFERLPLNSVRQKANVIFVCLVFLFVCLFVFWLTQKIRQLSPMNMCKSEK